MGLISWIFVLVLLGCGEGKPQIGGDTLSDASDTMASSLVSPWSQWMSMKAPPIPGLPMGGKKAKKKLIPGPPPPEGTPEAPWVSWTRMKVSSALTPTSPSSSEPTSFVPPPPPPPPPSPLGIDANDTSLSSGEPSVWIQWTQMKLPLTNPLTPAGSTPETPWDAWTKLKLSTILPPASPPQTSLAKRMAPDRYNIASTMAPRLSNWPVPPSSSSSQGRSAQIPPQVGQLSSPWTNYQDILNVTSSMYTQTSSISQMRPSFSAPQTVMVPPSRISPVAPLRVPIESLPVALRPIPHQLVSQIVAKATPDELTQVILAVSRAEQEQPTPSATISVHELLPSSLVAKLPDDLTPLLTTTVKVPPVASTMSSSENAGVLALIPASARAAIISKATPTELSEVVSTLAKLEALPSSEQAPLATVPVSSILPPSLQSKIPPPVASAKLVPPVLLSLPPAVVNVALPLATPSELAVVVANVAKLEKIPSLVPRPPLGALLPPSLVAKLPSQLAPLLAKPALASPIVPSSPVTTTSSIPSTTITNAIPKPILQEILEKASLSEIVTIVEALAVVEAIGTLPPPPLVSVIPPTLISKLTPELQPLLGQPLLTVPAPPQSQTVKTMWQSIPPSVIQQIVAVATPEELAEIKKTTDTVESPNASVTTPILPLLPASLVAKLPPQISPVLNKVVTIPPAPALPEAVAATSVPLSLASSLPEIPNVPSSVVTSISTALSKLPTPVISNILTEATPTELSEVAEIISKLNDVSSTDKSLVSQVEVATILPGTLLQKLPPSVLQLLATPIVLPEAAESTPTAATPPTPLLPIVTGVPPEIVATVAPVLLALPLPIVKGIISTATPVELAQLVDIITKLKVVPSPESALASKLEIETILPDSLVAKLPKPVVTMLAAPINIPPAAEPSLVPTVISSIPEVPPKTVEAITSALTAVPPEVVSQIFTLATPSELAEVAEVITKLETLPPVQTYLGEKIEVETILPASLITKLPPSTLPLLEVPVTISKTITSPPAQDLPKVAGVSPKTIEVIATALSAVPPPVVKEILTSATPIELSQIAEIIEKLGAVPPAEADLAAKVEVQTILPPNVIAKLLPSIQPLLNVPVNIPEAVVLPSVPGLSPATVKAVATALSAVPPPLVNEILSVATPSEVAEVAQIVAKLQALTPAETPAEKIEVGTILPETLIAKLPSPIVQLLNVPVTLPAFEIPPSSEVTPTDISKIAYVFSEAPPSVLNEILSMGTPVEIKELSESVAKLETLSAAEKSLASALEIQTILPPTLVSKLPSTIVPLLSKPITIPKSAPPTAMPAAPIELPKLEPVPPLVIQGLPPSITSIAVPALSSLPPPAIEKILTTATASELAQVMDTLLKLDNLTPSEKQDASILEVGAVLPPSLLKKLPSELVPLLSAPLKVPGAVPLPTVIPDLVPPPTAVPPTPTAPSLITTTILPALSALPLPVTSSILTTASLAELMQVADTISKLEATPPSQLLTLPVAAILPPPLFARLPSTITPVLANTPVKIVSQTTATPAPSANVTPPPVLLPIEAPKPVASAEEKVLTKWAKVILEKTGKPATVPIPGEIPPLQAAWMEWIQLKVNVSKAPVTTTSTPVADQSTTEYPWTQWLKLKSNATTIVPMLSANLPALDVTTESPEKTVLDWLEKLEKPTESPVLSPSPETTAPLKISPETEEMVTKALKDLGIEVVDLPPEQVKSILEQVEKTVTPGATSGEVPLVSPIVNPTPIASPPTYLPYIPYIPSKPFFGFWPPPPPYFTAPPSPLSSPSTPASEPLLTPPTSPTLNLTEYLITNSLIPAETSPSAPIPIPTLTKLITEQALPTLDASTPESTITANELSSLTPTKFAALLKQILQDCKINATTSFNNTSIATRSVYPNPYAAYYKKKYGSMRGKRSPSLYPIPSQAFAPTSTPSPLDTSSIPLPKVDTSGTVLDPAYWAAQKSMFLSKLFSTLAKVALNDTNNNQVSTPSPKEQLAKQVNTLVLSDMTRSVHHHPPKKQQIQEEEEEDSTEGEDEYQEEEDTGSEDDQGGSNHDLNQNEKELVANDNSEPDLPKEPENPLHKLFKFGVQKTVLSDLTTPAPAPIYVYITPEPYYPVTITTPPPPSKYHDRKKNAKPNKKKAKGKKKTKKRPSSSLSSSAHYNAQSHHHHANSHKKSQPYRFRPSSATTAGTTTTESPVDFELLAKALLLDDTTGNGPKSAAAGRK